MNTDMKTQRTVQLLDEVAFGLGTLREARARFSAQLAPEFSIFDYLRNDEMGLSSCIASLLDPNGTHGQGCVFLEAFIEHLNGAASWATSISDCNVVTEKQVNGLRRIDIYLRLTDGVIGIENKPWASDQQDQLSDYANFLQQDAAGKRWLLVYLGNSTPSTYSITNTQREKLEKDDNYFQLDYQHLIAWLEFCASKSRSLVVRVFIEELAKFVRLKVNGESDMSETIEVKNIILNAVDGLDSAFHIANAITEVKNELLSIFRKELQNELEAQGFHLSWDDGLHANGGANVGFGVEFHSSHNVHLRFEFGNSTLNTLEWGICRNDKSIPLDQFKAENINKQMEKHFGKGKSTEGWPWYLSDLRGELVPQLKNWGSTPTPWLMIRDKSDKGLVKRISAIAIKMNKALLEADDFLH